MRDDRPEIGQTVDANGIKTNVLEAGRGDPVVLIHGWPLTSASWEYQAAFLAENGCRVHAML